MSQLTLLQINDLHGYVAPHPELFDTLAGGFSSGGGLARIAALFARVRREAGDDAVVALDNGDTFHGSLPAVATYGEALVAPMSELRLDAMTAHWEFAYGLTRFAALQAQLPYPILAANIVHDERALRLPPFRLIDRGGIRIALIGLAAHLAPQLLPPHEREALRISIGDHVLGELVANLRRHERADLVVVVSHLGFPQDCKLAAAVAGIDVIASGHTHNRLEAPVVVHDTLIIQSGAHGSFVGRLDLEVTTRGIASWRHALLRVDEAVAADTTMQGLVDRALRAFGKARNRVVGTTRTALTRYTMLEATMDNLLLDAVAASAGVRLALSNGWRYGAPIPPGPVTEFDVWNIVPANPPVSVVTLTGADIRALFEDNLEATFAADPWEQRGGYVKRSRGLQLTVKLENPRGTRIQDIRADGDRLRADAAYEVAFLGTQAVPAGRGTGRRDTGVSAVDALARYLSLQGSVEAELRHHLTLV